MSDFKLMNNLTYKGYGRIYVQTENDIEKVKKIIKDNDEYEFETYYPHDLITSLKNYPNVVYIGKFELLFDLTEECKKMNIPIFIFDSGYECSPKGYYKTEPLTKEEIEDCMLKNEYP